MPSSGRHQSASYSHHQNRQLYSLVFAVFASIQPPERRKLHLAKKVFAFGERGFFPHTSESCEKRGCRKKGRDSNIANCTRLAHSPTHTHTQNDEYVNLCSDACATSSPPKPPHIFPARCMFLMCTWKTHRLILIYMQLPLCKGDERKNSYSAKSGHIRSLHAPHPSPWHHSTEKGFKCHRETACICIFILSSARAKAYKFRALRYATSAIEQDGLFSYLLSFRKKNCEATKRTEKSVATWCTFRMIYHLHNKKTLSF